VVATEKDSLDSDYNETTGRQQQESMYSESESQTNMDDSDALIAPSIE
jgi:hypothetical protein